MVSANANSIAQKFKYNGVELEESLGLNLYEMDWRGYDASLGRFMQLDPHSESYYEWSGYHFAANNPVFVADPDGQDWIINKLMDKDGNITYNITVNMAVMNSSSESFDMDKVVSTITKQLKDVYNISEENDDGTSTTVNLTANVRAVDNIDELGESEHLLEIRDKKDLGGPDALAASDDGLRLYISAFAMASSNAGANKRTIAHELGHIGGLYHPEDINSPSNQQLKPGEDDDNVMYQGKYANTVLNRQPSRSSKINTNQIGTLHKNYSKGKLNKQNNFYTIPFYGRVKKNPGL